MKAYRYAPNEYGLYCMAGNAAEWTSNAFDESAYNFSHDLNPDYFYEAKEFGSAFTKTKGNSWWLVERYWILLAERNTYLRISRHGQVLRWFQMCHDIPW